MYERRVSLALRLRWSRLFRELRYDFTMPDDLPATGQVRIRVLQVNTLTRGETVHDIKARVLPRRDDKAQPVRLTIRDELCPRPPMVGDRLRLTMQVGSVAGVEMLKPRKATENAADDTDHGLGEKSR